jgi:hypothetical protein
MGSNIVGMLVSKHGGYYFWNSGDFNDRLDFRNFVIFQLGKQAKGDGY